MKSSPKDKGFRPIMRSAERCVWMTAGILSYQLCDREFDCDGCPLDAAMQMHFAHEHPRGKTQQPVETPSAGELHERDYLYSRDHCWVKNVDPYVVRVGLEQGFASILLSPKAIALPSVGDKVRRSETCCWIILEGGTIPISSPVEGIIYAINANIYDEPHKLPTQPLTQGWLFEVQTQEEDLTSLALLTKTDVEKHYTRDMTRFNKMLKDSIKASHMSIGATLADGGQVLQDVSQMLGPKRYHELIKSVFCK
jgi:glycine cleavage system H protein